VESNGGCDGSASSLDRQSHNGWKFQKDRDGGGKARRRSFGKYPSHLPKELYSSRHHSVFLGRHAGKISRREEQSGLAISKSGAGGRQFTPTTPQKKDQPWRFTTLVYSSPTLFDALILSGLGKFPLKHQAELDHPFSVRPRDLADSPCPSQSLGSGSRQYNITSDASRSAVDADNLHNTPSLSLQHRQWIARTNSWRSGSIDAVGIEAFQSYDGRWPTPCERRFGARFSRFGHRIGSKLETTHVHRSILHGPRHLQ